MFISKKGPNLRRSTGIKISAKGEEVKQREIKAADKEKKTQPKKEATPENDNKGDAK